MSSANETLSPPAAAPSSRRERGWMWLALLCAAVASLCLFFSVGRLPSGARFASLPCGGMKTGDVAQLLQDAVEQKRVIFTDEEGCALCSLPLAEILGDVDYVALVKEVRRSVRGPDYPLTFAADSASLLPLLESRLFPEDYVAIPPRDAELVLGEEGASILPAEPGNLYRCEAFADALSLTLAEGIALNGEAVTVTVSDYRELPQRTEEDPLLRKQLSDITRWTDRQVELSFLPGLSHTLTPGEILRMLDITYTERGAIVIPDEEALRAVVDELIETLGADGPDAKYGRCAATRQYLYLPADDAGFLLDREKLYVAVRRALRSSTGGVAEAEYDYTSWLRSHYGWLGAGEDCLEISLDNQYVWFYRGGQLLTETEVVTGNLANGDNTRLGFFRIYGMTTDVNLKGPTWDDHVDYWMPFDGGIGIHDSFWRDSYGGDIYKEAGSHGCVNTPLESMAIIYDNAYVGLPVVVR